MLDFRILNNLIISSLTILLICSCSNKTIPSCMQFNSFSLSSYHRDNGNNFNSQREFCCILDQISMNEIYPGTDLSCSKILNDYFYCNICFNCPENNLTTFNGNNYLINSNNPIEITREIINLLKNMTMGGEEYELFLLKYPNFQ